MPRPARLGGRPQDRGPPATNRLDRLGPALVVGLRGILGTGLDWSHQTLYVPSLIPFILVSVLTWRLLAAPAGTAGLVWRESLERMRNPVPALLGALVFVRLLMVGGEASPVMILGNALANATGGWWQLLAAHLGALGSFFAGSNTISNLTFGPIQDSIAGRMGLDRTTILALQSVGGAMGNMVAIHNIVAVCSVLDEPELALSIGADAYLRKPVRSMQLLDCLLGLLAGRRSSPEGSG